MSTFQAVRVFSHVELGVFVTLMIFAFGNLDEGVTTALGWTHGIGWLLLCLAVYLGCRRHLLPWPLLAVTVFVTGPLGSSIGVEVLSRRGWT